MHADALHRQPSFAATQGFSVRALHVQNRKKTNATATPRRRLQTHDTYHTIIVSRILPKNRRSKAIRIKTDAISGGGRLHHQENRRGEPNRKDKLPPAQRRSEKYVSRLRTSPYLPHAVHNSKIKIHQCVLASINSRRAEVKFCSRLHSSAIAKDHSFGGACE